MKTSRDIMLEEMRGQILMHERNISVLKLSIAEQEGAIEALQLVQTRLQNGMIQFPDDRPKEGKAS